MSLTLTNARIVTPDEVIEGTLSVWAGTIREIQPGRAIAASALDLDGDYLLPGAVDLHTDNLERHILPRATARWPSRPALVSHDASCAAAGVTTVLDALNCGEDGFKTYRKDVFLSGVSDIRALADANLLRAEHFLHLRCELLAPDMLALLDSAIDDPRVRLASLMDHGPGVGQYADPCAFRARRRRDGWPDDIITERMNLLIERRATWRDSNRAGLLARAASRAITLASHDDRTEEEVAANHTAGIRISEFPVTLEAALAATSRGMRTIAGAPNIVRGGSHTENVAAADLLRNHAVDALASDYVPASLIDAAFRCASEAILPLPASIALISATPARMAGLEDRGTLAPGQRADLVQVRLHEGTPIVRQVWRQGTRIA